MEKRIHWHMKNADPLIFCVFFTSMYLKRFVQETDFSSTINEYATIKERQIIVYYYRHKHTCVTLRYAK